MVALGGQVQRQNCWNLAVAPRTNIARSVRRRRRGSGEDMVGGWARGGGEVVERGGRDASLLKRLGT